MYKLYDLRGSGRGAQASRSVDGVNTTFTSGRTKSISKPSLMLSHVRFWFAAGKFQRQYFFFAGGSTAENCVTARNTNTRLNDARGVNCG